MRNRIFTVGVFLCLFGSGAAATHAKKKSHGAGSSKKAQAATPRTPSADRYKEIQEALIAKGYLKVPATGVWDGDSQEAMRRFQQDQKLDPTGKLDSRSLISLGLGPKESYRDPGTEKSSPEKAAPEKLIAPEAPTPK